MPYLLCHFPTALTRRRTSANRFGSRPYDSSTRLPAALPTGTACQTRRSLPVTETMAVAVVLHRGTCNPLSLWLCCPCFLYVSPRSSDALQSSSHSMALTRRVVGSVGANA